MFVLRAEDGSKLKFKTIDGLNSYISKLTGKLVENWNKPELGKFVDKNGIEYKVTEE